MAYANENKKDEFVILVDGIPEQKRYRSAAAALNAGMELTWLSTHKVEIVKVLVTIHD